MILTIKYRIAEKLRTELEGINPSIKQKLDEDSKWHRHADTDVDLTVLTKAEQQKLKKILETSGVKGTKVLAADIQKFFNAEENGVENTTARTVKQAAWLMEFYVAALPHHFIFSEDEYEGGSYVGYYINDVAYHEEEKRPFHPAHMTMDLVWIENDRRCSNRISFYAEDVLYRKPEAMLKDSGYRPETPRLVEQMKRETERYYRLREMIGKKYVATGLGIADLDDAAESGNDYSHNWWRSRSDKMRMDNFGVPTPVVLDVLYEKDSSKEDDGRHTTYVNLYRWHKWNLRFHAPAEDELARHLAADENTDFAPEMQLPVHPLVPCFDLKRHTRLRVHVNNLTRYKFRKEVAQGLIIPERDRSLIDMLVDHSHNTFQDVVEGKGQSMNVLSGGSPGTGKTLTAEVFAEFKKRPLYSVQCSQLGLNPTAIEKNLAVILQRANRWNAVLLLDEADVYIRRRGNDLQHNAIVGVFLRMLEYASCILFMTTNLPKKVDDAIASRCIVRITYGVPSVEDQRKIWKKLSSLNSISISDGDIRKFSTMHPEISGRDVKNLLKLASFISRGGPVTYETLEHALQYKPTASQGE